MANTPSSAQDQGLPLNENSREQRVADANLGLLQISLKGAHRASAAPHRQASPDAWRAPRRWGGGKQKRQHLTPQLGVGVGDTGTRCHRSQPPGPSVAHRAAPWYPHTSQALLRLCAQSRPPAYTSCRKNLTDRNTPGAHLGGVAWCTSGDPGCRVPGRGGNRVPFTTQVTNGTAQKATAGVAGTWDR